MNRVKFLVSLLTFLAFFVSSSFGKVAFIGDDGSFMGGGPNEEAYEWAKNQLGVTLVDPDDIPELNLTQFPVLWWQEGDRDPGMIGEAVKESILDYLEKGGTLLLSAVAEKFANELGIEQGPFRIHGPTNDGSFGGTAVREDTKDHPVWEGFDRTPGTQIITSSDGSSKTSDYFDSLFMDAKTLGDGWRTKADGQTILYGDRVGAFLEWEVGDGRVVGMGWMVANWEEENEDRDKLEKLTKNIINYLIEASAFLAVSTEDKLSVTWGAIKEK